MAQASPDRFGLSAADRALCAEAIRAGSTSFHAASLLLPARVRLPARALYAFCRASDDRIDDNRSGRPVADALAGRLDRLYAGSPGTELPERAFAAVVRTWNIPRAVPEALIEGFRWDEAGRRYATLDELLDYSARVAGTVGVMMTLLMGVRDRHVLARAADLGLAMQLTNIARDVGDDARRGRVYLPLDWLAEAEIDPDAMLTAPVHTDDLGAVVARLLATADGYYRRALTGLAGLPLDCRPAIRAAALIYRAIGGRIAVAGFNSVDDRAFTSRGTKLGLAAWAMATPGVFEILDTSPADPSTAFLVDAAADANAATVGDGKVGRFLELLALSGERERQWTAAARGRA